jgi:hypothetical protein
MFSQNALGITSKRTPLPPERISAATFIASNQGITNELITNIGFQQKN